MEKTYIVPPALLAQPAASPLTTYSHAHSKFDHLNIILKYKLYNINFKYQI